VISVVACVYKLRKISGHLGVELSAVGEVGVGQGEKKRFPILNVA
jgi:hypothetical protein